MKRFKSAAAVLLALLLAGCNLMDSSRTPPETESTSVAASSEASSQEEPVPVSSPEPESEASSGPEPEELASIEEEPAAEEGPSYIEQLVADKVAEIITPGMSEYERAKALFDYMIENTWLIEPVGLDLWRIRGDGDPLPSYLENRSISVLLYGIGMCEDYAATFTLLLRGAGLEAEYVPGLTYSTQGALVDHAWTVAKIDGTWYHLDCQLEDNISKHGAIRYRYFMKSDATMLGSHRWGQNLIDSGLLSAQRNTAIKEGYIPPACPADYSTPSRLTFTEPAKPDTGAIQLAIKAEIEDYESENGPLEPLEPDIIPPVFGLEGYGPQE